MSFFKHSLSQVDSNHIGSNTKIWQFVVVLKDAKIGNNCNICAHCFIENDVQIGNSVTLKNGIYLWDGITLEDDVFLGPNVVFTNNLYPRSKFFKPAERTLIKKGASIGANSTILAGTTIGEYAMTGIGSVVTKSLKAYGLYFGNPAKHRGWVDELGNKLIFDKSKQIWTNTNNIMYKETHHGLLKI